MFKNFTLYAVMKDSKWVIIYRDEKVYGWIENIDDRCITSNNHHAKLIAKGCNGKVAIIHAEVTRFYLP